MLTCRKELCDTPAAVPAAGTAESTTVWDAMERFSMVTKQLICNITFFY